MRILMISEHASPLATLGGVDAGGQNIYVAQVARSLAAAGHEVDVLTRRDHPGLPTQVDLVPGARVIHLDAGPPCVVPKERLLGHMPAFEAAARRLMANACPYDVVHANFFMSGQVALGLRRSFGTPVVVTFHALGRIRLQHQSEADAFPPERLRIEDELVRTADALVPECPQDRDDLVQAYGADERRLHMVPCGVDMDTFAPMSRFAARAALGLGAHEFVVLQLGRIVPRKGVDNVIRAIGLLPADLPVRLLVVGGESAVADDLRNPEIARLMSLARSCGVADRTRFVGHRPRAELRNFYAAADVFVSTPWYEPFGITPLEAMACGTPVVGSKVGGIQYSVEDGVTGLLVPARDPSALAGRLALLQSRPLLARSMGRAGRRRVGAMFTWDQVARQLLAVYRHVATDARAEPPKTRRLHPPAWGLQVVSADTALTSDTHR